MVKRRKDIKIVKINKKIKDLTLEEQKKLCCDHETCGPCPLYGGYACSCNPCNYDDEILEETIEYEFKGNLEESD